MLVLGTRTWGTRAVSASWIALHLSTQFSYNHLQQMSALICCNNFSNTIGNLRSCRTSGLRAAYTIHFLRIRLLCLIHNELEMWANAQRDGHPAEYRGLFVPLGTCSTLQFGYAVMLPRRETRWNLLGCPKLTKWSQPLVGRSSPYCDDMWGRYRCLTSLFRLSMCTLVAKI